jgi:type IV secretory pathway TrbL component
MPGLTPAATASGDAPAGSGNRIASGDGKRSAKVPNGGSPDPEKTSSPSAVRATAFWPGMTGNTGLWL